MSDHSSADQDGFLLERLATLMPLVNAAVTKFVHARDAHDDLERQQQVCDLLVQRAADLFALQTDEDVNTAALLVHVLLDKVLTAQRSSWPPRDTGDDDRHEVELVEVSASIPPTLRLPSLDSSLSSSASSSSSSSSSSTSIRDLRRIASELENTSALLPRMLDLAIRSTGHSGTSTPQQQVEEGDRAVNLSESFADDFLSLWMIQQGSPGAVDVFQDSCSSSSAWRHGSITQLDGPSSVSTTSRPTSVTSTTTRAVDNDHGEAPIAEVWQAHVANDQDAPTQASYNLQHTAEPPCDNHRHLMRVQLDSMEAWIRELNAQPVMPSTRDDIDGKYPIKPKPRARRQKSVTVDPVVSREAMTSRDPNDDHSLGELPQVVDIDGDHSAGTSLSSSMSGSLEHEAAAAAMTPFVSAPPFHSKATRVVTRMGLYTITPPRQQLQHGKEEEEIKEKEEPNQTQVSTDEQPPIHNAFEKEDGKKQEERKPRQDERSQQKQQEGDSTIAPHLISSHGSMSSIRTNAVIFWEDVLMNDEDSSYALRPGTSSASVVSSERKSDTIVSVATRARAKDEIEESAQRPTNSQKLLAFTATPNPASPLNASALSKYKIGTMDPPGLFVPHLECAPQNDEMFWTCRVRWSEAKAPSKTRLPLLQALGKWGRKRRSLAN